MTTNEASHDEIIRAASRAAQRQHAELLAAQIILAAEIEPGLIRDALAGVFDLGMVEDASKRAMLVVSDNQQAALELRNNVGILCEQINKQLDEIEARIDGLHARLDEAGKKYVSLKKEVSNGSCSR